nr:hypothetical protein CFP56_50101 [Quercus suber]
MAEELEELWKKLTITEAKDEDIKLGSNSTRAVKDIGKNYMVMKILTQCAIILEALKKNMRMLWKPNKGMQIFEIEEDLFLVEFDYERDKKKVMEMCPWSYEKQLVLIRTLKVSSSKENVEDNLIKSGKDYLKSMLNAKDVEDDMQWKKVLDDVIGVKSEEGRKHKQEISTPPNPMTVLAWNYWGLGTSPVVRMLTEEVNKKNLVLVFLVETKANMDRMKGFQNKLGFTQGIIVSSDGRNGGLAPLWWEGRDIRFKSCSHSHIDVAVHGVGNGSPWIVTGFYGHLDTGKRYTSWQLLETLNA